MSNKRNKELKTLTREELTTKIRDSERLLFDSRMRKATGQLENVSSLWLMRKDLARMKFLASNKAVKESLRK